MQRAKRWGKSGFVQSNRAIWIQTSDLLWADAFGLLIGRIEPKIIPQHRTARFEDTQHFAGRIGFDIIGKDRRKRSGIAEQCQNDRLGKEASARQHKLYP